MKEEIRRSRRARSELSAIMKEMSELLLRDPKRG